MRESAPAEYSLLAFLVPTIVAYLQQIMIDGKPPNRTIETPVYS
jgi:hypothetical protein